MVFVEPACHEPGQGANRCRRRSQGSRIQADQTRGGKFSGRAPRFQRRWLETAATKRCSAGEFQQERKRSGLHFAHPEPDPRSRTLDGSATHRSAPWSTGVRDRRVRPHSSTATAPYGAPMVTAWPSVASLPAPFEKFGIKCADLPYQTLKAEVLGRESAPVGRHLTGEFRVAKQV